MFCFEFDSGGSSLDQRDRLLADSLLRPRVLIRLHVWLLAVWVAFILCIEFDSGGSSHKQRGMHFSDSLLMFLILLGLVPRSSAALFT